MITRIQRAFTRLILHKLLAIDILSTFRSACSRLYGIQFPEFHSIGLLCCGDIILASQPFYRVNKSLAAFSPIIILSSLFHFFTRDKSTHQQQQERQKQKGLFHLLFYYFTIYYFSLFTHRSIP